MFAFEILDMSHASKQNSLILHVSLENDETLPFQMFWNQRFKYLEETYTNIMGVHRTFKWVNRNI